MALMRYYSCTKRQKCVCSTKADDTESTALRTG